MTADKPFGTRDPLAAAEVILAETRRVACAVNSAKASKLVDEIERAKRVYVAGMGRSGLIAGAFAMRLVHLGFQAHVAGEMTAPAVASGDLFIAVSGSGKTRTIVAQAEAALRAGAHIGAVTALRDSPLADVVGKSGGVMLLIPAALGIRHAAEGLVATAQYGGSLFEQSTLLYLDGLVLVMAARQNKTESDMLSRHANLE